MGKNHKEEENVKLRDIEMKKYKKKKKKKEEERKKQKSDWQS